MHEAVNNETESAMHMGMAGVHKYLDAYGLRRAADNWEQLVENEKVVGLARKTELEKTAVQNVEIHFK